MNVSNPTAKLNFKAILPIVVGLAAFFIYILFFNVDISKIVATAQSANLPLYSTAMAVSIGEVFFATVSWRALLSGLKVKISFVHSVLYTWYSVFIDTLIPAEGVSGELSKVYLVSKEQGGISGKAVASVVMQRIIGLIINMIVLLLGVVFLFRSVQLTPLISNLTVIFTAALTLLIGSLLLISWKEKWSTRIINWFIRAFEILSRGRWNQRLVGIREKALNADKIFHDSMIEFRHDTAKLVVTTLCLFLNWFSSVTVPYLVFLSLGYDVPWAVILITSSIVAAVKAVPFGIPF
ncbi:flippase-like domain-containing protein [Candidatus Bathyarchaeota archaeon]|nr:flippase-like domain-containing protein [Candidatus Bathyarchaeota archaeon]